MKTFTTGEIAKYCDVNLRTVIRWIEKGELKGFKLPGRGNNRVKEEDFINFLRRYDIPFPEELKTHASNNSILIVDDEVQVAKAIKRVLKGAGYSTLLAHDGFKAGSHLMKERPGLMTLDLSMPGLDGYDVIRFVREAPVVSQTKILVISALDKPALEKAIECGADAYLQKPFSNSELLSAVELLLDSPQQSSIAG
ncbi:response regulator [Neptuniibacter caesariensis]|uniref:Response regulator n=1 Tax=Neptuniibacter caesariensis TaxID=207954 RepID=A0A7U8GSE8_NEPCE|nr:response regulator [Neptuniibacter caesariensis]EAR61000.1 response regulator [Neptuniibacter caesariensis]